jgi:hypothetical protein
LWIVYFDILDVGTRNGGYSKPMIIELKTESGLT